MRIYLVFYKLLLELALLKANVISNIKLKNDEYEPKKVRDLQKISR